MRHVQLCGGSVCAGASRDFCTAGLLFGWREEGICIARHEIGKLRHKASTSLT